MLAHIPVKPCPRSRCKVLPLAKNFREPLAYTRRKRLAPEKVVFVGNRARKRIHGAEGLKPNAPTEPPEREDER